jgi:polyisoprenoid-binding protein YceI
MKWSLRLLIIGLLVIAFPATSPGETYKIDNAHSTIAFRVHQFISSVHGKFKQFSGTIDVDRENPERSSVNARIQVKSIDTGIRKRDDHLCSADFFNAEKYPEITFKSRSVKQTGAQSGDITGDFTMHGVTKPIVLHVKLVGPLKEEASHWEVTTDPLKRRDYNLMFGSGAEAVSGIGQEVAVKIDIVSPSSR